MLKNRISFSFSHVCYYTHYYWKFAGSPFLFDLRFSSLKKTLMNTDTTVMSILFGVVCVCPYSPSLFDCSNPRSISNVNCVLTTGKFICIYIWTLNTIDLMFLMCFIPQIVLFSLFLLPGRLFGSFFHPSSALCLHLYYCQNIFFLSALPLRLPTQITMLCDQKGWKGREKKTNKIFVDFHMKFDILNRINRLNIKFRIYGKSELLLLLIQLDDDVGVHLIKESVKKKSATINDIKSHSIGVTRALMNGKF